MSAIKYLLETQREIYDSVALATGTPSFNKLTEEKVLEDTDYCDESCADAYEEYKNQEVRELNAR